VCSGFLYQLSLDSRYTGGDNSVEESVNMYLDIYRIYYIYIHRLLQGGTAESDGGPGMPLPRQPGREETCEGRGEGRREQFRTERATTLGEEMGLAHRKLRFS
jgi:hypothetical protein